MAKRKSAPVIPSKSMLEPGKGSQRVNTRFIVAYGGPGAGKTTAASTLKGAKWLVSDSNCVSTLQSLDRLPPDEDLYEISSLTEARMWLSKALDVAATNGPEALGCTAVIADSVTQFSEWHKEDVAKMTNQAFLGERKGDGWQRFNAEFGGFVGDLASLSKYITVVVIAHSKEKSPDFAKGQWAGLNLSPDAAFQLSAKANWILHLAARTRLVDKGTQGDEFTTIREQPGEFWEADERALYTVPHDNWMVKAPYGTFNDRELPDLAKLLAKVGMWRE